MTTHTPAHAAHSPALPLHLSLTDRLQLTLALCCALTGTPWGFTMAVVVLGVLTARRAARRALDRSLEVRRGVLTPPQQTGPLHAAGRARQATTRM
jgi:hypothetical protein